MNMNTGSRRPEGFFPKSSHVVFVRTEKPGTLASLDNTELTLGLPDRADVIRVDSDLFVGGPWAGLRDLFSAVYSDMARSRPDLVSKHALELMYVLPYLRRHLVVATPTLTDLASPKERTRNYAADRAYRIVHGLIDMLEQWWLLSGLDTRHLFVVTHYDVAGSMTKKFLRELMRRKAKSSSVYILIETAGNDVLLLADFDSALLPCSVALDSTLASSHENKRFSQPCTASTAESLERELATDDIAAQDALPQILNAWTEAGVQAKILQWKYRALDTYNTQGLYEDSLRYGEGLLSLAKDYAPDDHNLIWSILIKTMMSHIGLQEVDKAILLAEGEATRMSEKYPKWKAQLHYLLGTFYARYSRPRNLSKGEEFLNAGLAALGDANLPEAEYQFQSVFNRNGLAMVRHLQGRHEDAISLCEDGIQKLNAHLSPSEHHLHRSVLLYNIAQVYAAARSYRKAVDYYSAAMDMDPYYSEYYNERGGLFLKLGEVNRAKADFLRAIELSPPYFEVFTNLGQAYREDGDLEEAIAAYSRSIELEPSQPLAFLGRGKTYETLGVISSAIADYTAALHCDAQLWDAYANRGVLFYNTGLLREAVNDFSQAITITPENPDLYQNRGTILAELGMVAEAVDDFQKMLDLNVTGDDADYARAQLNSLGSRVLKLPPAMIAGSTARMIDEGKLV